MFIRTKEEILSLMPTARWDKPEQLLGYLEEEERVALEPLLGTELYEWLCKEYERLTDKYVDITSATVKPTRKAKTDPGLPLGDVTDRLDAIQGGMLPYARPCVPTDDEEEDVPETDMMSIRLIRICQQIEFYRMLSHKAGMLVVSFNEGGGANRISADGYEPADEKDLDRLTKDAFMSAGRSTDSLLLFLEADAKGGRQFTELWSKADAFYLQKDLLFQTARALQKFLDIRNERVAYIALVRDIRFCQNSYLKPAVGQKLLKAAVAWANEGDQSSSSSSSSDDAERDEHGEAMDELVTQLRTALAFFVESRRVEVGPKGEKLARRDSMTDARQAMAMVCQWIEQNLDALGDAAVGTPIYNAVHERERQEEQDRKNAKAAAERRRREACESSRRKLFTAFPHTHVTPEHK